MPLNKNEPKVLIIDDDMQMRFYIKTLVDSLGFEPILAKNGAQGIQVLDTCSPSVIILDIMMPEKGGTIVYQELIGHPEYQNIPIIFFSGVDKNAFFHHIKMLNTTLKKKVPVPGRYIAKDAEPQYFKQIIQECVSEYRSSHDAP